MFRSTTVVCSSNQKLSTALDRGESSERTRQDDVPGARHLPQAAEDRWRCFGLCKDQEGANSIPGDQKMAFGCFWARLSGVNTVDLLLGSQTFCCRGSTSRLRSMKFLIICGFRLSSGATWIRIPLGSTSPETPVGKVGDSSQF